MNKRRLLKLADLLEADAKNKKGCKFDLGELLKAKGDAPRWDCGTTACAIGLAMISGAFRRQGLGMRHVEVFDWFEPTFQGEAGFGNADAKFFDVTDGEHNFLFTPDYYPKRKRTGAKGELFVAKRIRDFVAGKVSATA